LSAEDSVTSYLATVIPQVITIMAAILGGIMWMKKSIDKKVDVVKEECKAIRADAIAVINEREKYLRHDLNRHERTLDRLADRTGVARSRRADSEEENRDG
jgi:hypothetical protein